MKRAKCFFWVSGERRSFRVAHKNGSSAGLVLLLLNGGNANLDIDTPLRRCIDMRGAGIEQRVPALSRVTLGGRRCPL